MTRDQELRVKALEIAQSVMPTTNPDLAVEVAQRIEAYLRGSADEEPEAPLAAVEVRIIERQYIPVWLVTLITGAACGVAILAAGLLR